MRYRVKYSKLVSVVVVVVMLGVGFFSSTAHAGSPWNDYWQLMQLVAKGDIHGMTIWAGKQVAFGYSDLLAGEVIRAAFEHSGYTCFDKPLPLWWWLPDSSWYILTCAKPAG